MTNENSNTNPEGFEDRVKAASGEMLACAADGMPVARAPADKIPDLLTSLRDGPGLKFEMLTDLCGVDEYPATPRFEMIYHLRSLTTGQMVRIKSFVTSSPFSIPSVVSIYPTADWHEREVYDMMGIEFEGHPDLKRILMPLEYEGYPLRKDFPLEGIEPDRLFRRLYPE